MIQVCNQGRNRGQNWVMFLVYSFSLYHKNRYVRGIAGYFTWYTQIPGSVSKIYKKTACYKRFRHTSLYHVVICHIAIPYSMGQIIKSVFVCLSVCLSVCICSLCLSVDTPTVAFFIQCSRNSAGTFGSVKEELIRLGSKSKNAFPYFSPKNQNFGGVNRHFKPNLQNFQIVISSKLYIGLA